ncbi:MAG: deoxyribose-phosphate aldolase [Methanobacterium sp.]
MISPKEITQMIDHTNVKGDATEDDIKRLCSEALQYNFASACVTPTNVILASKLLKYSDVKVCAVVGFPLGVQTPKTKAFEAMEVVSHGADEIDMVINIGGLKSNRKELVKEDIQGVVESAGCKKVKVIIETALLNYDEKVKACLIAKKAGADFVKTSTGFGGLSGATVEDVTLMRRTVGSKMGVKAAGGIRDLNTALAMIDAGATRIGTSTGVQIMEDLK